MSENEIDITNLSSAEIKSKEREFGHNILKESKLWKELKKNSGNYSHKKLILQESVQF
jgi:hypothetical protein